MLAKKFRLSKTTDVQKVFSQGRAFFNSLFTVRFRGNPGAPARFTVVVSTKVAKLAVKRNRIKRVIREFVRLHIAEFKPGDYLIVAKPAARAKDGAELVTKFAELVKNSKLLN